MIAMFFLLIILWIVIIIIFLAAALLAIIGYSTIYCDYGNVILIKNKHYKIAHN